MKTTLFRVLSLALLGLLSSCSKKPVEVTGQVFVITKGRDNIKMGGVGVRVIPDEEFVKAVQEVLPWLEEAVRNDAQATTDADHMTAFIREIIAMEGAAEKPIPELLEIRKALVEESGSADNLMESALAAPLYQQAVAKVLNVVSSKQEVTTDADGRFTVQATGKTWFISAGGRVVGDDKESYLWIKGFEPAEGSETASLVIANESDIGSDDQFHALISGAVGKAGGLEPHRAAGKATVSKKMKTLVAGKRAEAEAAKLNAAREEAEAYAKLRGNRAGEERQFEISPGVIMTFCWCPAGKFMMGSPASEAERSYNEDQVEVSLTRGYWMAKTEVSQAQWEAVMGENPSNFMGGNRPVENVSWNDAQEFLQKLNARLGNADGGKMVLPTEAQWEYAARAGQAGVYAGGGLDEVAWYNRNSGDETRPVGTKKANAWGLHDMSGNVIEWCQDWHEEKLSGGSDPSGPDSGSLRVYRGGSWCSSAYYCRVANRYSYNPTYADLSFGFRVARSSVP
jgi:formylglycine-generating enzyme required for sulfatase activity